MRASFASFVSFAPVASSREVGGDEGGRASASKAMTLWVSPQALA